jgi:L-glutamine-phosphate cytidylyltransferase
MQGVILAAGKGSRMGSIDIPKCLLEINQIPIIKHQINSFKKNGINDILVVTGYKSEMIHDLLNDQVEYVHNSKFNEMNNIYSVWLAIQKLHDDFVCVYGDLIFDEEILKKCLEIKNDIGLMVEPNTRNETMKVLIKEGKIIAVNKKIEHKIASGNFIGMAKFSSKISKILFHEIDKLIKNSVDGYYTLGIEKLIDKNMNIGYQFTNGLLWMDMDEKREFEEAKRIFRKEVT